MPERADHAMAVDKPIAALQDLEQRGLSRILWSGGEVNLAEHPMLRN